MPTETKKEYLHLFQTQAAHDAAHTYQNANYEEPWVAYTVETESVSYNLPPRDYFTTVALGSGTISMVKSTKTLNGHSVTLSTDDLTRMSCSTDGGKTWQSFTNTGGTDTQTLSVNVTSGQKIMWKGLGTKYGDFQNGRGDSMLKITSDTNYEVCGNVLSLLLEDDFSDPSNMTASSYTLAYFFNDDTRLISAEHLVMPSSMPASSTFCFAGMFSGCSSLTKAPTLPATVLTEHCYDGMFKGCTSLTTAPALPATTLANYCYNQMFYGCTSLTTAPALPATTLANYCYDYMFSGCTALTTTPELPATTLASGCYYGMFFGCTSLTAAPALPATTLVQSCYDHMFSGCTALTTTPELPATTLAQSCYNQMFYGCTALTTASALTATTLAETCYGAMFLGCTSLTTAPALPATTLTQGCYNAMFRGCTALTTAPVLPATTLVQNCYSAMFEGCSNLNYIKAMFTTAPSGTYTSYWVDGVAASGTYVKNSSASYTTVGIFAIPSGWTVETASS